MSQRRRFHMRALPEAWRSFGAPNEDGTQTVVRKRSLKAFAREAGRRSSETPADAASQLAAEAKRERRRARNQEAQR